MFNLTTLIETFGYLGLFAITFCESGLLIGFLLPGDSLLFTAGFLTSQGHLHIWGVMAVAVVGAIGGDSVGYAFGRQVGPRLFKRNNSLLFNKEHLVHAQKFYKRHGGKTIILARFLPFVRTFAPILAGVGKMRYSLFFAYNVIGGIIWACGLSLAGYFLGNLIPGIDRYLLPVVLGIIVLTTLPGIIHVLRDPSSRRSIIEIIKKIIKS